MHAPICIEDNLASIRGFTGESPHPPQGIANSEFLFKPIACQLTALQNTGTKPVQSLPLMPTDLFTNDGPTDEQIKRWLWRYGLEAGFVLLAVLLAPIIWGFVVLVAATASAVIRLIREQRRIAKAANLSRAQQKHIWSGNLMWGAGIALLIVMLIGGGADNQTPTRSLMLSGVWLVLAALYIASAGRLAILQLSAGHRAMEVSRLQLAHALKVLTDQNSGGSEKKQKPDDRLAKGAESGKPGEG